MDWQQNKRAAITETCRAQGLLPSLIQPEDWMDPGDLCQMFGNSMPTNVLLRIMVPLIGLVRPEIDAHDPWATGAAQDKLRRPARDEYISEATAPQPAAGPRHTPKPVDA